MSYSVEYLQKCLPQTNYKRYQTIQLSHVHEAPWRFRQNLNDAANETQEQGTTGTITTEATNHEGITTETINYETITTETITTETITTETINHEGIKFMEPEYVIPLSSALLQSFPSPITPQGGSLYGKRHSTICNRSG